MINLGSFWLDQGREASRVDFQGGVASQEGGVSSYHCRGTTPPAEPLAFIFIQIPFAK